MKSAKPQPVRSIGLFCFFHFLCTSLFAQAPVIESFSPSAGSAGSTVVISGSGFSSFAENNIVYFGAVKGVVKTATPTSISVTVPAGATNQPLTVTTGGLTAYSINPFNIVFGDGTAQVTKNTFSERTNGSLYTSEYAKFLLADIDGDRKLDACVRDYRIAILRNMGSIGNPFFTAPVKIYGTDDHFDVCDLNGDGKVDMICTYNNTPYNQLVIQANSSKPANISFGPQQSFQTDANPGFFTTCDIDIDGRPDIILANFAQPYITIFRNTSSSGSISFDPNTIKIPIPRPPNGEVTMATADFDGDKKPDILVSDGNFFSIIKNISAPGNFNFENALSFGPNNSYYSFVLTGDFNNDGKTDIVIPGSKKMKVFTNTTQNGIANFGNALELPCPKLPFYGCVQDVNGDGRSDIAISIADSGSILVYGNISQGLETKFAVPVAFDAGKEPRGISCADVDGDGKPDLVVTNNANYPNAAYLGAYSVLRNITGKPSLHSFNPDSGYTGVKISITGSNLSLVQSVMFGSTKAASFNIISDSLIEAIVGEGATGHIKLITAYDSIAVPGFTYLAPVSLSFCPPAANKTIHAGLSANTYRWQQSIDSGKTFIDISNNEHFSGADSVSLHLVNLSSEWNGFQLRCLADTVASNVFKIEFSNNWTGSGSSMWEDTDNWSCGALPDGNTDVYILAGDVILNSNASCRSLTLRGGATLTIKPGFSLNITH